MHDNTSISFKGGAVFGLHFQSIPFAEAKPVRQVLGRLSDVTIRGFNLPVQHAG